MGKFSRDKGANYEREVVNQAKELGLDSRRVPLSGALEHFKGDVQIKPTFADDFWTFELKRRKELPAWMLEALGENAGLILRADNEKSVAVIPLTTLLELMQ